MALPKTCDSPIDVDVMAMGNGATNDNSTVNPELNFAFLKTLTPSACSETFPMQITKRQTIICAGNPINGQSVCQGDSSFPSIKIINLFLFPSICQIQGDSGGPLVQRSDDVLIALSSFVNKGK